MQISLQAWNYGGQSLTEEKLPPTQPHAGPTAPLEARLSGDDWNKMAMIVNVYSTLQFPKQFPIWHLVLIFSRSLRGNQGRNYYPHLKVLETEGQRCEVTCLWSHRAASY